jgi:antitoxin component YwqK of YwqJK toxin-antitoxin module
LFGLAAALWYLLPRPINTLESMEAPAAAEVDRSDLEPRDGLLYRQGGSDPFSGWMTEAHPDGSLRSRSQVVNGQLHGLSEGWSPEGRLQVQEPFERGLAHGIRTKWYPSGGTQSVAHIVQGQLQGPFQRWHENGVLAEDVMMQEGQPHGLSLAYYPSGHLKAQVRLDQGKVVEQRFWNDGERRAPDPTPVTDPAATPPTP